MINGMQPMIESTLEITHLLVAIPDDKARRNIVEYLAASYQCLEFDDVETLTNELDKQQTVLILCHQSLMEEQQAVAISELKAKSGENSKILIIGPNRPIETQISALKHGARGYFDEVLSSEKLHEALKLISNGEVWVERHVISGLIDEIVDVPVISEEHKQALDTLSPKEIEVATQVSYGATNKMIAKTMKITERTVKAHLTTIFQKMNIADRLSLAIFFRDLR